MRDGEINKSIKFANNLVKKGIVNGFILASDFNYGELSWNEFLEPEVLIEAEPSNNFLETLNECFLSQNVFFKTYQEAMKLTNVSDLVITESKERVYELEPGHVLGGKDNGHLCLTWKYNLKHASLNSSVVIDKFKKSKYNFKLVDET